MSAPSPIPDDGPTLAGWGRRPAPGRETFSDDLERATENAVLMRGLGRSYGDSSLPATPTDTVVNTTLADRLISFDEQSGSLRAEAGFPLSELNRLFMPRGWFTPVSPGTKFVTVGGMVASDVHGKNHHVDGCFGEHVSALRMRVADGRIVEATPQHLRDLFDATIGGMGLTGHILEVEFKLKRIPTGWIWMESERIPDIDAFIEALKKNAEGWPYTMGWIDCVSRGKNLGRGILMRGRWAEKSEAPERFPPAKKKVTIPFVFPEWALNSFSVRCFNVLYYWKHLRRFQQGICHPDSFFYPLDAVHHWNKVYGRRGFTQYQCVLPNEAGRDAARQFLMLLTARGGASPLCVIKDCGDQGRGTLSFPMPGISIAVDLAVRDGTQALVDELNEFVLKKGGRIYLTKDAFTRGDHYAAMEPRLETWKQVRARWDPAGRLRSAQSVRILGDSA